MLTVEQFRTRASIIYNGQRDRQKKQLMKSVPKGVKLVLKPDEILPYSRHKFGSWLWARVGLQVILCPYCGAPIDILNLVIDHKVPLKLGGSIGLDNQEPICAACNGAKGALLPEQYIALLKFLRTQGPTAEADILSRLKMGGGFLRTAFINRKSKHPASSKRRPQVTQESLALNQLGPF